jgi:hypothetical protein
VSSTSPPAGTGTVGMFCTSLGSTSGSTTADPSAARTANRPAASSATPTATVTPGCPVVARTSKPVATPKENRLEPRACSNGSR